MGDQRHCCSAGLLMRRVPDGSRRGRSVTLAALAVTISLMAHHPRHVDATLTFQQASDLLGLASTFEEGTGLPTRDFTLSITARSASGRDRVQLAMCDFVFYLFF